MVESFFHEEPYDPVGVEDEVASFGVFVSNHAVGKGVFSREVARDRKPCAYVNNAMSCGVCGRICTFSKGTSLEMVAVGFSAAGRYFGPSPCSGAGEHTPGWLLVAMNASELVSCAALASWDSYAYPELLVGITIIQRES